MLNKTFNILIVSTVAFLMMTGCDLLSLDVDNPANIEDTDLDTQDAVTALKNGVHGDYAFAMVSPGGGGLVNAGAMLTDELVHVGTWVGLRGLSDGLTRDNWVESQSRWAEPSRARWTAEDAIRRISELVDDPSSNSAIAEVTMWAGFANRSLGDNFEYAIINGGPQEPIEAFYNRAINHFNSAASIAQSSGDPNIRLASIAGRAQVNAMLGNWTEVLNDAAEIDTDFVFEQVHSDNSGRERNMMRWWGFLRDETSLWGTPFAEWGVRLDSNGDEIESGDPRVTYMIPDDPEGGDGRRPFWAQLKYPNYGANIAVVKGTEMRLLEAEYEAVQGDYVEMINKINEVRAHHGLDLYDSADGLTMTEEEAWELLMMESGIELWLEARRLPNLRRWQDNPGFVPFEVVREEASGQPYTEDPRKNVLDVEGMYIKISENERQSNPNL